MSPNKYYESSVWHSAMRSRRNIKDIANANQWDYFVTMTWPIEISRDYCAVKKRALSWKRDIEHAGGKVLLVVGSGERGGHLHVHALVRCTTHDFVVPGVVYAGLIEVKTHGRLWMLKDAAKYDIGQHVVQAIGTQDDINRIADYMAGHVLDVRDMVHNGIMAGVWDQTVHAYYATRGLQRSRRIRIHYLHTTIRLYDNRAQLGAVVLPTELEHTITDYIMPHKIERYNSSGMMATPMSRITGIYYDIRFALIESICYHLQASRQLVLPYQDIIKHWDGVWY